MSQSPYSWRVSTGVAFALALAVLIPLAKLRPGPVAITFLLIAAIMTPVSWYEARMRADGYRHQDRVMDWIEALAERSGSPKNSYQVVWSPPETTVVEDRRYMGPRELTWGYEIRTPGMWHSWGDEWMVGAYLNYRKMAWRPANSSEQQQCRHNCTDGPVPSPRLMRLDERSILVCPDVLPQPTGRCLDRSEAIRSRASTARSSS
jgi:hypothetical protein